MAVYVDALRDYQWHLGKSCHMIADTESELIRMAVNIGLREVWMQRTSLKRKPHFDLTASRRLAAVKSGAIELTGSAGRRRFMEILYAKQ